MTICGYFVYSHLKMKKKKFNSYDKTGKLNINKILRNYHCFTMEKYM